MIHNFKTLNSKFSPFLNLQSILFILAILSYIKRKETKLTYFASFDRKASSTVNCFYQKFTNKTTFLCPLTD